jgi:two-component system response regulator RstA
MSVLKPSSRSSRTWFNVALLRRVKEQAEIKGSQNEASAKRLTLGSLVVDSSMREVLWEGNSINLTSADFDLLWLLSRSAGHVLTREEIFHQLRGIEYDGQDRSIDVRVSRMTPQ